MTSWIAKQGIMPWGTKIVFILLSILMTGWLVYAGLCNMWEDASGHNSENWQNRQNGQYTESCMMWESGESWECIMWWEWKGNAYGMQNMTDDEKWKRFQHMMGKKWENFTVLSQNLEEIIDLADKVWYDTAKLKAYQTQLEEIQKEYGEFGENIDKNIEKMCNNKQKWRWTNGNMRELMNNISVEFKNIKSMAK